MRGGSVINQSTGRGWILSRLQYCFKRSLAKLYATPKQRPLTIDRRPCYFFRRQHRTTLSDAWTSLNTFLNINSKLQCPFYVTMWVVYGKWSPLSPKSCRFSSVQVSVVSPGYSHHFRNIDCTPIVRATAAHFYIVPSAMNLHNFTTFLI